MNKETILKVRDEATKKFASELSDFLKANYEHYEVSGIGGFATGLFSKIFVDSIADRLSQDWVKVETPLQQIASDVMNEVIRAKTLFPANFVNQHEAYAVILEEVDELWDEIKKNQKVYDLTAQRKEAIQACAMLFRLINELLPQTPE